MSVLAEIAGRAAAESPLWAGALLPEPAGGAEYEGACPDRYLLGVEMIREAHRLHGGESRLFSHEDPELALLTGDYLYAAGLVEICATGDLAAVASLAELITRCASDRGERMNAALDHRWSACVGSLGR
jgi:hypothetical protein